jgi:hypothetical protein
MSLKDEIARQDRAAAEVQRQRANEWRQIQAAVEDFVSMMHSHRQPGLKSWHVYGEVKLPSDSKLSETVSGWLLADRYDSSVWSRTIATTAAQVLYCAFEWSDGDYFGTNSWSDANRVARSSVQLLGDSSSERFRGVTAASLSEALASTVRRFRARS